MCDAGQVDSDVRLAASHALLVVDAEKYRENIQLLRAAGMLADYFELNKRGYIFKYGCDDFEKRFAGAGARAPGAAVGT